ncbi:MAG: hypothetical protein PWQ28_427 [Candidatus Woesearchaeota archaeon]|nr:hypothetical protein [Candidatus Woesearchaeota archaeon]
MTVGVYTNLFLVEIEDKPLKICIADRSKFQDLKDLRSKLKKCGVFAYMDKVYGYGENLNELLQKGFIETNEDIQDNPHLVSGLLFESFGKKLQDELKFNVEWRKIKAIAFDFSNVFKTSCDEVNLLRGYEFRTTFLFNKEMQEIVFGLIIDLKHRFQLNGNRASLFEIRRFVQQNYDDERSKKIIIELRSKTGDLTPYGRRNEEASRFRYDKITEFVRTINNFTLPTTHNVTLFQHPTHVNMEGEFDE